jgi:MFS family permease
VRFRLSLLMFLQYAAPSAFLPLYSVYLQKLGYDPFTVGCFCATQGFASVLCPLIAGQVADRWWPAERCLAVCSFFAGAVMWLVAGMTAATPAWMLFTATLAYWLLTVPILLLGAAICFAHVKDPTREYGRVRLWGTVGWMVQGWLALAAQACLPWLTQADCTRVLFRIGGGLAFVLSAYALTLPATPPQKVHLSRAAPVAAVRVLRSRPFFVYCVCMFGLCVTTPVMTQGAPLVLKAHGVSECWLGPTLSLAQLTEVLALALLPVALWRFGVRGTMLVGLGAWMASLCAFALGGPRELVVGSLAFNGLCISGFFVAGQVFVNRHAGPGVRASVQALLTFVNGLGVLVGNVLVGILRHGQGDELPRTFTVGAGIMAALLLLFLVGFRERKPAEARPAEPPAPRPSRAALKRLKAPSRSTRAAPSLNETAV